MKILGSLIGLSLSALLQAQLNIPQVGAARYADGSVHQIHGVDANLMVDSRTLATADTVSFSDATGLIATNGLIRLLAANGAALGEYHSGEAAPILHSDATAQTAAVWLPSKHVLLHWNGSQFVP